MSGTRKTIPVDKNYSLVHHFLEYSATRFPSKIALVHDGQRFSYNDINRFADNLAYWLVQRGLQAGDRVVILLENSLEYVTSYYGILKTGAVAVPLDKDSSTEQVATVIENVEPFCVITSSRFERIIRSIDFKDCGVIVLLATNSRYDKAKSRYEPQSLAEIITGRHNRLPSQTISPSDAASIIFTSGSTSKPKGVVLSHANLIANVSSIIESLHLNSRDVQMVVLPFSYVFGKSLLNTHFAVGGTIVINNRFAYPADVLRQMVREGVTGFSGVPSSYAHLLYRSPLRSFRSQLTTLRYCAQAGGNMPVKIKQELREALPDHTDLFIMYGATEAAARLTCLDPGFLHEKPSSIGKPITGVSLTVVNENGTAVKDGEVGELVAKGPNVMVGYWKDQASTQAVMSRHGYHTGDLGYKDTDGFYYVVDRKDNMLKIGGYRVNPQEVEEALSKTDLILESIVIGFEDHLLGKRLVTLAVPKDSHSTSNKILERLSSLLPKNKIPSEMKLCRALPLMANGKTDKWKCLRMFETK